MQPDRTRADTKSSSIVLNCEEPRFLYERTREKTNSDYWVTTPKDSTEVLFIGQRCEILHTPPPGTDSCCCPYRANFFPHSSTKAHPSSRSPPPPPHAPQQRRPGPVLACRGSLSPSTPSTTRSSFWASFYSDPPHPLRPRFPSASWPAARSPPVPRRPRSASSPSRAAPARTERRARGRSGGGEAARRSARPGPDPPRPPRTFRGRNPPLAARSPQRSASIGPARPGHAATYGARRVRRYGGRAGAALRLRGAERGGPSRVCRAGRFGAAPAVRL